MNSPVDQIKERLNIVDVVSSYVKLEKAGINLKARCPFHNEKTPSFFVSPTRNNFHCFGCGKSGDIFTFTEEIEGVPFATALKILAEKAGVNLSSGDSRFRNEQNSLYGVLEEATKFFEGNLGKYPEVRAYLEKRGLKEETIADFRVGFAPDGWRNLLDYLKMKGFDEILIDKAGLAIKGPHGYYDRFRNRVMFPIGNSQGKILGFSGRIFGNAPDNTAKYVNSPETVLFNKSRILFGYDKARQQMMRENTCILVEGQLDLLMAHQAGSANTVASSGTALTEDQIDLIRRFAETLIMAYDADEAGLKASERGVKMALMKGFVVKIIRMPKDLDPADLIVKDPAAWTKAVASGQHIVDFYLDQLEEDKLAGREYIREVGKKVLPFVKMIGSALEAAHYVKIIAERAQVPEDSVREELGKLKDEFALTPAAPAAAVPAAGDPRRHIENKIFGLYLWGAEKGGLIDAPKLEKEFMKSAGRDLKEEVAKLAEAGRQDLIFQAEMYYGGSAERIGEHLEELLVNLERKVLDEKVAELSQKMRAAEKSGNQSEAEEILKTIQEVTKRLHEIKNSRFTPL